MSALRGLAAGVLSLSLLDALISTDRAANNASGLITVAAGGLRRLIDPTVPLIPDRRDKNNPTVTDPATRVVAN